ncbi:MAG: chorismate mutase, partial [Clostridia bacterium]|nr:chorismate mutase [Clostridia bacterium]
YKRERGLPVLDREREEALIRKNVGAFPDEELKSYYADFLRGVMKTSRAFQEDKINGVTVAFCGVPGAYAGIAAKKIVPGARLVAKKDFRSAYDAVTDGECTLAVLPIENSTAGEVAQVTDMLFNGSLFVTGIYDLAIRHSLLGIKGTKIEGIKKIVSHPQALAQCESFIQKHGWEIIACENTAVAAKKVAESGDPTLAAIAAGEAAGLYGLSVLAESIADTAVNTTRFAVLSRAPGSLKSSGVHSVIMFTVRNEAGSLAKAIDIIGSAGFNMRALRSRPMKELLWQYYFYAEVEGEISSPKGEEMMKKLSGCCDRLKKLGSFTYPATIA